MAIINSRSYRILNARTVISILNSKSVQTTSYPHIRSRFYDFKKTSESKILLLVKPSFSSNTEKIYDDIAKLFSVDVLLGGKKVFTTGSKTNISGVDFILTLQRGTSKVEIYFRKQKQDKKAEIMRPGILNEEYFVSKINDEIQKINEAKSAINLKNIFDPNLNIILTENNTEKDTIYKVSSIERTGQDNNKQDAKIKTKNNTDVLISLKKENFGFWSSASEYDAAKKILDYLVNNKLVNYSYNNRGILTDTSNKPLNGIRFNATVGEVKKYCFGEGDNQIDYILIRSFDAGYFKEIRKITGGLDYRMKINCAKVYKKNARDIIRLKKDVYLTIVPSSKNASGLGSYKGLLIQFETNNHSSGYYEPNLPAISFGRL